MIKLWLRLIKLKHLTKGVYTYQVLKLTDGDSFRLDHNTCRPQGFSYCISSNRKTKVSVSK